MLNPEFSWLDTYLDNDSLWLDDSINWDDVFDLAFSDYNLFSFLTSPFFVNSHFFLDSITKLAFNDILLMSETDSMSNSREFFDYLMWDLASFLNNNFLPAQLLFVDDELDFASRSCFFFLQRSHELDQCWWFVIVEEVVFRAVSLDKTLSVIAWPEVRLVVSVLDDDPSLVSEV